MMLVGSPMAFSVSTAKYVFLLTVPTAASIRPFTSSTLGASQRQTAFVPSLLGRVWCTFRCDGRPAVAVCAVSQNVLGLEISCSTMMYMLTPMYGCWMKDGVYALVTF